jgi:hypothetical protein
MIKSSVGIAAIGLLIAIHAPTLGVAGEGPLQLGVAVVNITPPIGYRMSGYFYERPSTGVLNPLQAKALVIAQGDVRFAWVFCDLIGTPSQLTAKVRDAAAAATEIPRDGVVIAATHSHTGPLYFGALRDYFHSAARARTGADPHEAADYPAQLTKKLISAIRDAAANTTPIELRAGVAEQPGLAFNRRYVMRDGSVKTNPGKLNPDILRPAGPTDPEAGLLQFRRAGKPVAGLTVFALHCDTTGGTEFAADYPYFLEREIQQRWGTKYVSAFAAGTCGDVNHLDVSHDRPQKGIDESERIGSALAATVIRALDDLPLVERPDLASASKTVAVALQRYSPEEVARARTNLAKVGTRELPGMEQVAAVKIVGVADYETGALPMEVQVFRLSKETALVALPGELFAELGLAIKRQSPFATTLVVELCNDYPGYIPTRRGFAEGGYEPTNSKVEPGGGELLVDTAVELLRAVKAR